MIVLDNAMDSGVDSCPTLPIDTRKDTRKRYPATASPIKTVFDRNADDTDVPPMLPPWLACVAEVSDRWWVIETQTKYEKSLAWKLLAKELPYYLPLTVRVKMYGSVRRKSVLPLFSNYIFVAGEDGLEFCRDAKCVLNILTIGMQKRFINELSSLEIALFGNPRLEICDIDTVGQKVKVTGGAFEGLTGEVESFHNQSGMTRVVIRVATLGCAALDVDRSDLESIQ